MEIIHILTIVDIMGHILQLHFLLPGLVALDTPLGLQLGLPPALVDNITI